MAHLHLEPIGFVVQRLVQPKHLWPALAGVLTFDLAYFSRWDFSRWHFSRWDLGVLDVHSASKLTVIMAPWPIHTKD